MCAYEFVEKCSSVGKTLACLSAYGFLTHPEKSLSTFKHDCIIVYSPFLNQNLLLFVVVVVLFVQFSCLSTRTVLLGNS